MKLFYRLKDRLFKADNLEELKNKVVDFYSMHGLKPIVEINDGMVYVEIDTIKIQKAENLFKEASKLANESKFEDALDKYFEVVRIAPHHADSLRAIAQIQMLQGDLECAIDSCIEALRWDPENLYSLILMGNIFNKKGDRESTKKYYERVLEIDPANILAQNNLSVIISHNYSEDTLSVQFVKN